MKLKKLYLISAVTLVALCNGALSSQKAKTGDDKQKQSAADEKWFDLQGVGEHIVEEKKEILLTPKIALELFQKEHPKIKPDWLEKLGQPIEPAEKVSEIPKPIIEREEKPHAAILRFSKRFMHVMILQPKGYYRWHRYAACLANFKIPRNPDSDTLFDMESLERIYTFRYKGIGYGSGETVVRKALGEPDAIQSYSPFGFFIFYYFKDDIAIQFQNMLVRTVTPHIPPEVKKEVEEHGKHIVRG